MAASGCATGGGAAMSLWWQLCKPWLLAHKGRTIGALCVALSTVFAGIGLLTVAGWFLTAAFLSASTALFNLFVPSALIRGLSMWRIVSRYGERITGHTVTLDLQAEIRSQTFAQLAALPPAQLARYRDGDLVSRLIHDVERLDSVFLLLIVPAFTAVTGGVLYALLTGTQMPWAGVAVLGSVLLGALWAPYWVAKGSAQAGHRITAKSGALRGVLHDALEAHVDVAVFNAYSAVQQSFDEHSVQLGAQRKQTALMASLGGLIQQVCMGFLVMAMLWLGLYVYQAHELNPARWVGLLLGAMGLFEIMAPLMRGAASLGLASSAAARLQGLQPEVEHDTVQATNQLPTSGALSLEQLDVGYDPAAPLLRGVNLSLAQGERLLIRGISGVGKTTLLHTMMGVLLPLKGAVRYAGVDIQTVPAAQRFRQFALLSQHSTVFMGSIRHNLSLAKPNASDAELWAVLEQVRLARFVQSLSGQLDGWVGEGGNTLSTGQKRRLCLARILLTPASVWVLDEPLSGLDNETALALLQDMLRFAGQRTVVMVSHDPVPEGLFAREMQVSSAQLLPLAAERSF